MQHSAKLWESPDSMNSQQGPSVQELEDEELEDDFGEQWHPPSRSSQ